MAQASTLSTPEPTPPMPEKQFPGVPAVTVFDVDTTRTLCFDWWSIPGQAYDRFQNLVVLTGSTATVSFYAKNWVTNVLNPFVATQYALLVDGIAQASCVVDQGARRASFTLELASIPAGWHRLDIGAQGGEVSLPFWIYLARGAIAQQEFAPAWAGSFDLTHGRRKYFHAEKLPAVLSPRVPAAVQREYPSFGNALPFGQLFRQDLVPTRSQNIRRPNRNKNGLVSTCNEQSYFFSSLVGKLPRQPLLDGPRGVGCVAMPTHIQVGRLGGAYVCDPWRLVKVATDGSVATLAGYRHKDMGSYYDGPQELELVGDWSAIPEARRGFHELWGMTWDARTLPTDESAAPIDGEKPHLTGPVCFLADTRNNRIVKLQFNKNNRNPPVVTEFVVGLDDPWDVVYVDGLLYVSERKANRIASYSADTGAFVQTLLAGQGLATVPSNRTPVRNAGVTLDQVRAQACVLPEGLAYLDGWLYFGSKVMQQVKRINLTSLAVEVVCAPFIDGNSNFVKIALSDGSFGPRGTVFTATWSNNNFGYPEAFLPGGAKWNYYNYSETAPDCGRGGVWTTLSYTSAMGVALGRMHCGSAAEGLVTISQALPSDPPVDTAKFNAGKNAYMDRGYHLVYGDRGNGYYGYALPWGVSDAIDYYLTVNGHARG